MAAVRRNHPAHGVTAWSNLLGRGSFGHWHLRSVVQIQIRFRHQLAIAPFSFSQLEDRVSRHVIDVGTNRARWPNRAHDVKRYFRYRAAVFVLPVRMSEIRTLLAVDH